MQDPVYMVFRMALVAYYVVKNYCYKLILIQRPCYKQAAIFDRSRCGCVNMVYSLISLPDLASSLSVTITLHWLVIFSSFLIISCRGSKE